MEDSSSFKTHLHRSTFMKWTQSLISCHQSERGRKPVTQWLQWFKWDQHSAVSSVCFTDNKDRHKEIEQVIKRKKKSYGDRYFTRLSPGRQERQDCPDWHWRKLFGNKRKHCQHHLQTDQTYWWVCLWNLSPTDATTFTSCNKWPWKMTWII